MRNEAAKTLKLLAQGFDRNARQTSPFSAGKDSAFAAGELGA